MINDGHWENHGSEAGSTTSTKKKEERDVKFLVVWWWSNENAKAVTERFMKWKQKGKWKTVYPISTMVGRNKAFMVSEADDVAEIQKDVADWTDLCTYDLIPIMESKDAVAVSRQ